MFKFITSPKFVIISLAVLGLIVVPLTIIQSQSQQNTQQNADEIAWLTDQSAVSSCPEGGDGAVITVQFNNTEPNKSSMSMDVVAKDQQTGTSVDLGSIPGGSSKTDKIHTTHTDLDAGSVLFTLKWTDGHSGVDSRTATYKAVHDCSSPTPTPVPSATPTPLPSGVPSPTPTICPTLAPVQNVKIKCPNCP